MAEETTQGERSVPLGYGYAPKDSSEPEPRRGYVNPQQRKLHMVMTAFNVAKVAAIVLLFLLVTGMI